MGSLEIPEQTPIEKLETSIVVNKTKRVINSCDNWRQLETARRYAELARQRTIDLNGYLEYPKILNCLIDKEIQLNDL